MKLPSRLAGLKITVGEAVFFTAIVIMGWQAWDDLKDEIRGGVRVQMTNDAILQCKIEELTDYVKDGVKIKDKCWKIAIADHKAQKEVDKGLF